MENTNLKELVIDGQPQRLGNRMVTYDGLVDFLEMLKNEIPRMGKENTLTSESKYSLALGEGNLINGKCTFVYGVSNNVRNSGAFVIGDTNYINTDGTVVAGTGLEDGQLSSRYARRYLLGSFNIRIEDIDNPQDVALCFGSGLSTRERENLLVLRYDGGVELKNGHFITPIRFDNTVSFQGSLTSSHINVADTLTLNTSARIVDAFQIGGFQICDIYSQGALRPYFLPLLKNEMIWSIENDNSDDTLHINYRSPISDKWTTPKTVVFHQGTEDSRADIECGKLTCKQIITKGILQSLGIQAPVGEDGTQPWKVTSKGNCTIADLTISNNCIFTNHKNKLVCYGSDTGELASIQCASMELQSYNLDAALPKNSILCMLQVGYEVTWNSQEGGQYSGSANSNHLIFGLCDITNIGEPIPVTLTNHKTGTTIEATIKIGMINITNYRITIEDLTVDSEIFIDPSTVTVTLSGDYYIIAKGVN